MLCTCCRNMQKRCEQKGGSIASIVVLLFFCCLAAGQESCLSAEQPGITCDGQCIPQSLLCDGEEDCSGGFDEDVIYLTKGRGLWALRSYRFLRSGPPAQAPILPATASSSLFPSRAEYEEVHLRHRGSFCAFCLLCWAARHDEKSQVVCRLASSRAGS